MSGADSAAARELLEDQLFEFALSLVGLKLASTRDLLGRLASAEARAAATVLARMPSTEQTQVLTACVKTFHPSAARRVGAAIAESEQGAFERFRRARLAVPMDLPRGPRLHRPTVVRLLTSWVERSRFSELEVTPSLFRFATFCRPGRVVTEVHLSSSAVYFQHIDDLQGRRLISSLSFLALIGISSQTAWDQLRRGGEEAFVDALRRCADLLFSIG